MTRSSRLRRAARNRLRALRRSQGVPDGTRSGVRDADLAAQPPGLSPATAGEDEAAAAARAGVRPKVIGALVGENRHEGRMHESHIAAETPSPHRASWHTSTGRALTPVRPLT